MLALKAENISKQYRLGQVGTGTLSHDLNRFWHQLRGKEDPYLRIGETNDRTSKGDSEYVWSLRDIDFEIEQGDAVGIIGRNGAGKSTLLKLLSKVTKPTTGQIFTNGRIASLLEVGTGFHPEMTGRENVFLNGAILGMTRKEITRKFDEIVNFSGVERYIDTPVKRYSSGMYVRLAFAVAAHLESEILIVDEVLAVGDAEFQKKCLAKMSDVTKDQGRTILFVSHNMTAIKSLCNKGIVLSNGNIIYNGITERALSMYNGDKQSFGNSVVLGDHKDFKNNLFDLNRISLVDENLQPKESDFQEDQKFSLLTDITIKDSVNDYHLSYVVKNFNGEIIFTMTNAYKTKLQVGNNKLLCDIPKDFFNVGEYIVGLYIIRNMNESALHEDDILTFRITERNKELGEWLGVEPGFIKTNFEWQLL
ncbi:ABC transporter ATP-binding protein [Chryseobacterium polytrichastri]|uniref:Lipopolysaccharide transport system ATP-binding protein n=1 Tax=Chryseobacterium polytrichastri TaxID=1302687 RepID=A0A1M6X905_9FLAO|nr:polysaccharide ABC transporter ATP-binding protein [Chryseobacterium polytrichastri]SHL02482.1 lipopolysaccharide transport system ATP-binding protein [Chryseobacterium polytrichastri]